MATCSFKTKLALSLTAAFSFFAMVFSLGGITLAAYLNAIEAEYSNKIDFKDLGKYFNGVSTDSNTGKTTYQISNADQLRNLQMLVSLGLFDENDIFNLTSDFTWSGTAMAPIGSDDMPFNSTFNGCGHTITGLQIACSDGRDAGLFGYTSITSEVKNLILASPTITVTKNSNGNTEISGSPVEAVLSSAAKGMPDIAFSENGQPVDGSITVINDSDKSQSTIKGFPKTVRDINGNSYEVIYESSDEKLIQPQNDGSFITLKTESAISTFDLFAGTITAKVGFIIDDRFGYYVLERYQFNVTGGGLVSTATVTIGEDQNAVDYSAGAFKTIHSQIREHSTYTGFFIGHCDGKANHLGLYGGTRASDSHGKIVVNSPSRTSVYSARTLIGMTRTDNPIDASAGDTMNIIYDFAGKIVTPDESPSARQYEIKDIEEGFTDVRYSYGSGYGNQEVNDIYDSDQGEQSIDSDAQKQRQNADSFTGEIITNETLREYSSIYPGSNPNADDVKNYTEYDIRRYKKPTSYFGQVDYSDNADTEEANDKGSFNGLVIDGGLGAGNWTRVTRHPSFIFFTEYRRAVRGFYINNGFMVWPTKNLSPLFGENLFYINISITYVAKTKGASSENQGEKNSFQILFNLYNPDVEGNFGLVGLQSYKASYAQHLFWQDLSYPYSYADLSHSRSDDDLYNPEDHKIIDDGKLHTEKIQIKVDADNGSSLGNAFSNFFTGDRYNERYPILAIGMGSNTLQPNANSSMQFYADIYNGTNIIKNGQNDHYFSSNTHSFEENVPGKTFLGDYFKQEDGSLVANGPSQTFGITGNNDGPIEDDYYNKERAYFNSFFSVDGDTKLYIKDLKVTFTNREGNTEDIIYNVDYVSSSNSANFGWNEQTMSYARWPQSSNVMIGFDMSPTAGGVTYSFYRNGNTVYGNSTNATAYPLQNVGGAGYTDAILGQG